jgi:hypothetical protein
MVAASRARASPQDKLEQPEKLFGSGRVLVCRTKKVLGHFQASFTRPAGSFSTAAFGIFF